MPSIFCKVLVNQGHQPPKSYKDDRVAWEIVEILGAHFREMLRERLQQSPFYGIMADETTDNSVEKQLVIYVKFLDNVDDQFMTMVEYLDLVTPDSGSAEDIKVFRDMRVKSNQLDCHSQGVGEV